jgi:hypothetical protein
VAHEVDKNAVDLALGKCDRSDFAGVVQTVVLANPAFYPHAGKIMQEALRIKSFELIRYESMAHQAEEFCEYVRGTRGKPIWLS